MIVKFADFVRTLKEYFHVKLICKKLNIEWYEVFKLAEQGKVIKDTCFLNYIAYLFKNESYSLKNAHLARIYMQKGYEKKDLKEFIVKYRGEKFFKNFSQSWNKVKKRIEKEEYEEFVKKRAKETLEIARKKKRKIYSIEDRIAIIKDAKIYNKRLSKKSVFNYVNSATTIKNALLRVGISYQDAKNLSYEELKEKILKHFLRTRFGVLEGKEEEFFYLLYQKRSFKAVSHLTKNYEKLSQIAYKCNVSLYFFESINDFNKFKQEFIKRLLDYYNLRKSGIYNIKRKKQKKLKKQKREILIKSCEEYALVSIKTSYEQATLYTKLDDGSFAKWLKNRGFSINKFKELLRISSEEEILKKLHIEINEAKLKRLQEILEAMK